MAVGPAGELLALPVRGGGPPGPGGVGSIDPMWGLIEARRAVPAQRLGSAEGSLRCDEGPQLWESRISPLLDLEDGPLGLGGGAGGAGGCYEVVDEVFPFAAIDVYVYKAVNNARMAAWRYAEDDSAGYRLMATWIDDDNQVALGAFNPRSERWSIERSAVSCGTEGVGETLWRYSPVLPVESDRTLVDWFEQIYSPAEHHRPSEISICGVRLVAGGVSFADAPRRLRWNLGELGGAQFPNISGMHALYPTMSVASSVRYLAFTDRSELAAGPLGLAMSDHARAARVQGNDLAVDLDPPLVYDPATVQRTADPSVATAEDGSLTVFVWEERPMKGGVRLAFQAIDHSDGDRVDGPYLMRTATEDDVHGGDVSVQVLAGGIYVAAQPIDKDAGGVRVFRLARPGPGEPIAADAEWEVAELSEGWLPSLSGGRHEGTTYLVVAHEYTLDELNLNENKEVELSFLTKSRGGALTVVGTRRLGLLEGPGKALPVATGNEYVYQLSPTVVLSPAFRRLSGLGGDAPMAADVFWWQVETFGGSVIARLAHARFVFNGPCLSLA